MSESSRPAAPLITVGRINRGERPFRTVQIRGEFVGQAYSLGDVIGFARRAGLEDLDYDDPDLVRWLGGDMYTWGQAS